ncbi:MAG: hypothetical protein BCS36_00265 [Desulfovibrio sp. MES5]|uniref:AAA family ATPase n=1 Tax=Desulfovibrio sp. MES5 TaxID=1899016 RepID=UPI000B9D2A2F|nr:AAA family ATPase [Desulfovibrio sp. MES5]OXS29350.1 MAG: hypothetical protein BCS36_00265 [Desulfovibrio sp. MES5]
MSDFSAQYALWDKFLVTWPIKQLPSMTLDEYTRAGSKDSFTYWIESRLDKMGSIWGGSAFKFGVYSRKDTKEVKSDSTHSYSDTHGWYTSLGATAEQAFEKVRDFIVQVATWANQGNIDAIDAYPHLGESFKWKIAFHYQSRQRPNIVNVFKQTPLAVYVGGSAKQTMGVLQKTTLASQPTGMGILEYGHQVWESWSQKNLVIWKLSHGDRDFGKDERQQYLDENLAVIHRDTALRQGEKFINAPCGTVFYLCHGNSPQRLCQFTSRESPCPNSPEGWVQRSYRVLKPALRTDRYTKNSKKWSPMGNSTFWKVDSDDLALFESTLLKPYFGTDLAELAALAGEFDELDGEEAAAAPASNGPAKIVASKPIAQCFNRIYYGPPGTGKTYTLMQFLKQNYVSDIVSITDAEWRSQFIADKISSLKWWEGIVAALYDLGKRAKVFDIAQHPFIQAIASTKNRTRGIKQTLWGTLQSHTVESSETVNTKNRMNPAVFDKVAGSEWRLVGDWQDICSDVIALVDQLNAKPANADTVQQYSLVTFHQSYGYEEFVEGLRPVLSGEGETDDIAYEIRAGAFKDLCNKARQAPDQRFAMVIDEINRGNISKIFGELITLIEPDKRDPLNGNAPPLELTLAYSGEKFSVPANIDIIGTMNTADRSLALLDTALRRRFDFVPLLPDVREQEVEGEPHSAPLAGVVVNTKDGAIDIRQMLMRMNERIEALYDRDHCIGHAYFTKLKDVDDGSNRFSMLKEIFRNRIIPLLEEYFFEDWQKIRLVLGDNQKNDVNAQFIAESDHQKDLNALFGNNHGIESYMTKCRYVVNPSAFGNPQAYMGIYQPLE